MIAYTDGSCLKNGSQENSGGFGVVLLNEDGSFCDCHQKFCENTTNNQEELKAILYVLLRHGKDNIVPTIYSDSAYCINSLTNWIYGWACNGWTKSDKRPPENLELMKTFYNLYNEGFRMNLVKVRGHNGIKWNEIADGLATGKLTAERVRKENE